MAGVGTNRYAYSENDPVNKADNNGHFAFFAAIPAACAGGGCEAIAAALSATLFGTTVVAADKIDDGKVNGSALGINRDVTAGKPKDDITSIPNTVQATRPFGDLETIDGPAHNKPRRYLEDLSDDELKDSIFNPDDGQRIKVKPGQNKVLDGNGRIKEAKKRGIIDDNQPVPVDEVDDGEDIGGWERDLDKSSGDSEVNNENSDDTD